MASLTEEIADALAQDVIRAAKELGDDNLITDVSRLIGASSTTTQEAFMTAVRVRMSEQRARQFLIEKLGTRYDEIVARATVAPTPQAPLKADPVPAPMADPRPVAVKPPAAPAPQAKPQAAPDSRPGMTEAPPRPSAGGLAEPAQAAFVGSGPKATKVEGAARAPEVSSPEAQSAFPASQAVIPSKPSVKPRPASSLEKPAIKPQDNGTVAPSPSSLAAALALAASLPRASASPTEPKPHEPSNYSDIEIPDGDWG